MERRMFLAAVGTATVPLLSGCSDETDDDDDNSGSDDEIIDETTSEESDDPEETETGDSENGEDNENGNSEDVQEDENSEAATDNLPNVEVVIGYNGDWSGEIDVDETVDSVSGSGDETLHLDITENTTTITASIQKDDNTSNELTVEIIVDGEVETEGSVDSSVGNVTLTVSI